MYGDEGKSPALLIEAMNSEGQYPFAGTRLTF